MFKKKNAYKKETSEFTHYFVAFLQAGFLVGIGYLTTCLIFCL